MLPMKLLSWSVTRISRRAKSITWAASVIYWIGWKRSVPNWLITSKGEDTTESS